jgi:hypothetical protein
MRMRTVSIRVVSAVGPHWALGKAGLLHNLDLDKWAQATHHESVCARAHEGGGGG